MCRDVCWLRFMFVKHICLLVMVSMYDCLRFLVCETVLNIICLIKFQISLIVHCYLFIIHIDFANLSLLPSQLPIRNEIWNNTTSDLYTNKNIQTVICEYLITVIFNNIHVFIVELNGSRQMKTKENTFKCCRTWYVLARWIAVKTGYQYSVNVMKAVEGFCMSLVCFL